MTWVQSYLLRGLSPARGPLRRRYFALFCLTAYQLPLGYLMTNCYQFFKWLSFIITIFSMSHLIFITLFHFYTIICLLSDKWLQGLIFNTNNQKKYGFRYLFLFLHKNHLFALRYTMPHRWRGYWVHWHLPCRGVRPRQKSFLDMTLSSLMVRFHYCRNFGECGVPLYWHRSQVHSVPGW